jgi:hypothetical protein
MSVFGSLLCSPRCRSLRQAPPASDHPPGWMGGVSRSGILPPDAGPGFFVPCSAGLERAAYRRSRGAPTKAFGEVRRAAALPSIGTSPGGAGREKSG